MLRDDQIELIEKVVERFAALADASRLRLLLVLRDGPANVSALTLRVGIAQAGVSKHLGVLKHVGLVGVTRQGNQAIYRISDERVFDMCAVVCDGLFRQIKSEQVLLGEAPAVRRGRVKK